MTTIATDGKTMAADGLECQGGTITGRAVPKIHRLPDGRLLGCCGNFNDAFTFREWLENGGAKPKVKDFSALVLATDGTLCWYDKGLQPLPSELPAAIGSGMDFALAAMDAGCTPEQAVQIACERDSGSGGTISVFELHPKAKLEAA